jgi:hypothetical protein
MPRGNNPLVWLSALVAASALSNTAHAQSCENPRPTEASATRGLSYGGADVDYFDSSSGRVRVHFALSGTHAPPQASTLEPNVPDAVVVAARAADDALDKYLELGYQAPLGDGSSPCSSNGASDALDIYMLQFSGADGQVTLDHCPDQSPKRCAGFVLIDNDFRGGPYQDTSEGVRTVVPHELFHLVQDSYDADVERWWAEGSAQWAAKQVYPELEDLERFLPAYFDNPWRPLNVPPSGVVTDFLYATAIWPVFLQERYDTSLVREVYEGLAGPATKVLTVTDRALEQRGSSLAEAYLSFASYNAATGDRAPESGGYARAPSYPEVAFDALGSAQGELVSDVTSGLSAFYYSLSSSAPVGLTLEADPARLAGLLLPLVDGKPALEQARPLPATLTGDGLVVVAGQSTASTDAPFKLSGKAQADVAAESASCGVSHKNRAKGGEWPGFVVILLSTWRAWRRPGLRKLRGGSRAWYRWLVG